MKKIAVIGAGGYVGARLMEQSILLGNVELVPIVRSWRSQGRLARYGVRTVVGDAGDSESLVPLLKGCGMAVNLTMGENGKMVDNAKVLYEACRLAGVPLLVHVSSAEVFGRAEMEEIGDDSVPKGRHWMAYARAKRATESWLRTQFHGPVKIVILRPGLIWGPGSGWLVQPAKDLTNGNAYLFDHGNGICNLIHVDNFILHLLELANEERVESGLFNISDNEKITWWEYYCAIAKEISVDQTTIHLFPDSAYRESIEERVTKLLNIGPMRVIKRKMRSETKVRLKQYFGDRLRPSPVGFSSLEPELSVTKGIWWVQGTQSKLSSRGFATRFPEMRLKSFTELMTAAGHWLRFAGFQEKV